MPIRPQHRWLYPIDWPQITAAIRFGRAKGRCEHCDRPHGKLVCHLGDGRWWDEVADVWKDGRGRRVRHQPPAPTPDWCRTTKVYLATAHLDNNPGHNHLRNLKALCQRCHMIHDREEHRRRRRISFLLTRALGDLFDGPYSLI